MAGAGRLSDAEAARLTTPSLRDITDRLDRMPASRFHVGLLLITGLSLYFDSLDIGLTAFVFAALRTAWGISPQAIGIVAAIGLAGFAVGSLIVGFIADRFGRKPVIISCLILYSAFSALRGLSPNITVFCTLNFLAYVFVGMESCTVPIYLAELWPSRVRGAFHGWMMGFFSIGTASAPLWALLTIPNVGWRWALFLTAPFACIVGFMRSGLPESPRWLYRQGRVDEAEAATAAIEQRIMRQTGAPLPPVPVRTAKAEMPKEPLPAAIILRPPYRWLTLMLWSSWLTVYGVFYTFLSVLPTLLVMEGYSIIRTFQFSIVIYGGFIPGFTFAGYFLEWVDRKYWLLTCFVAVTAFGTLFGFATATWQVVTFASLTAFFLGGAGSSIYTYTPEIYPTEIRATAMGIASAWGRVGAILLLLAFGVFSVLQGKLALFLVSDVSLIVSIVLVAAFGPSTRQRPLEDTSAPATVPARF